MLDLGSLGYYDAVSAGLFWLILCCSFALQIGWFTWLVRERIWDFVPNVFTVMRVPSDGVCLLLAFCHEIQWFWCSCFRASFCASACWPGAPECTSCLLWWLSALLNCRVDCFCIWLALFINFSHCFLYWFFTFCLTTWFSLEARSWSPLCCWRLLTGGAAHRFIG